MRCWETAAPPPVARCGLVHTLCCSRPGARGGRLKNNWDVSRAVLAPVYGNARDQSWRPKLAGGGEFLFSRPAKLRIREADLNDCAAGCLCTDARHRVCGVNDGVAAAKYQQSRTCIRTGALSGPETLQTQSQCQVPWGRRPGFESACTGKLELGGILHAWNASSDDAECSCAGPVRLRDLC